MRAPRTLVVTAATLLEKAGLTASTIDGARPHEAASPRYICLTSGGLRVSRADSIGSRGHGVLMAVSCAGVLAVVGCGASSKLHKSSVTVIGEDTSSGYDPGHYKFDVFIVDSQAGCTISQTAKVLVDGVEFPFMYDCTVRNVAFAEDRGFTIRVEDEGDTAEVVVNGLAPGLGATFLAPVGGRALPGDALTISVPAAFQSMAVTYANFAYLDYDDPAYRGEADAVTAGTTGPTTQVAAPLHPGHFTFWMRMRTPGIDPLDPSFAPATVTSCSGFAACDAAATPLLGPLSLEVVN